MQVDKNVLYLGIANQPSSAYSFLYFIYFFFSLHFSSKTSPQLYRIETSNLVYRLTTTSCIVELKMGLLLFVLPYVLFFFLSLPDFSSKISLQPFKIETLNLVYRFTTTSCDVGLKMDILLFVLSCIFLSLYIFCQRYQPYALEALKRGIVRFSDSSSYIYLAYVPGLGIYRCFKMCFILQQAGCHKKYRIK